MTRDRDDPRRSGRSSPREPETVHHIYDAVATAGLRAFRAKALREGSFLLGAASRIAMQIQCYGACRSQLPLRGSSGMVLREDGTGFPFKPAHGAGTVGGEHDIGSGRFVSTIHRNARLSVHRKPRLPHGHFKGKWTSVSN